MIRPFTCVCLLMAAGSGLYLYQTKHQTQMVDREIEHTLKLADAAWQRSGVLRAEYTLLNDPSRLADLSSQYLTTLQTTAPGQFSTWADFDRRLPAVGPPPADPATPDIASPGAPSPGPVPPTAALQAEAAPEPARPESAHAEQPHPEAIRSASTRSEPSRPEATRVDPPRADQGRIDQARIDPAHSDPIRADPPRPPIAAVPSRPVAPAHSDPAFASVAPAQPRPPAATPVRMPAPAPAVARSVLMPVPIAPPPVTNIASIRPAAAPPVYASEAVSRVTRPAPASPTAPMVGSALGMARTIAPAPVYTPVGSLR